jgi:hypothetical protein
MTRPRRVREPIQVYLTSGERDRLDRLAEGLGVSRAEVLRRGIDALAGQALDVDPLDALVGAFGKPAVPADLAERHDAYLVEDVEREWRGSRKRRRSS